MATPSRALSPETQSSPPPKESSPSRSYKIPGTEIDLPRWAVHVLAAITVFSVGYRLLNDPIRQYKAAHDAGTQNLVDQNEAYKHYAENPVAIAATEGAGGKLEAKLYASDGCIAVIWHGALDREDSHPHFIRKLTDSTHAPAPGRITMEQGAKGTTNQAIAFSSLAFARMGLPAPPAPSSNCLNPHPGAFKSWYGENRGCWIQVWRQFPDGCTHYQWYNKCGGFWDANPNGTPRVYWTECHH